MKVLKKDLKHGKIIVAIQNLDDLWHLSQILEKGDLVSSKTTRKVKATEKETEKKTMFLELAVEEVEFKEKTLRVNGKTIEEKDDVPKGSFHTITLEPDSTAQITKDWPRYQLKRLEQATKKQAKTLILVLDREEALFALLKSQGYEILARMKGKVAKKDSPTVTTNFYKELSDKFDAYIKRFNTETLIVASPAFWKDDFLKEASDEIKKRVVLATCSSVGSNAIEEILKRPELKEVLKQQRTAEEAKFVDKLMLEISKEGLAAYGNKQVAETITAGNVKELLITDVFISKNRKKSEQLLKNAEAVKGEVIIINSENEAGKKLDSLGGIAVLLRYKAY